MLDKINYLTDNLKSERIKNVKLKKTLTINKHYPDFGVIPGSFTKQRIHIQNSNNIPIKIRKIKIEKEMIPPLLKMTINQPIKNYEKKVLVIPKNLPRGHIEMMNSISPHQSNIVSGIQKRGLNNRYKSLLVDSSYNELANQINKNNFSLLKNNENSYRSLLKRKEIE